VSLKLKVHKNMTPIMSMERYRGWNDIPQDCIDAWDV